VQLARRPLVLARQVIESTAIRGGVYPSRATTNGSRQFLEGHQPLALIELVKVHSGDELRAGHADRIISPSFP
jgi:hypothetical protein